MKKRNRKILGGFLLFGLVLSNVIFYNHAYRFTHFGDNNSQKTKRPEELSLGGKLEILFMGINIPKPKNAAVPSFEYETVFLESEEKLAAWHVKRPNSKGTILMFHGYSSSKSGILPYSEVFNQKGYSTFLVDFMGSGESTGFTTTVGFKESKDVKVAFDYIKAKNPNGPIILFGTSMGAVAIMKAIQDFQIKPDKIILECPFGSMRTTTKKRFEAMNLPSFPFAEILLFYGGLQTGFNPFRHNPTEYAKAIDLPTLLLYGAKDARVTRPEIDEIFQNLKGAKQLGIMHKSEHEVYLNDDSVDWNRAIDRFLE